MKITKTVKNRKKKVFGFPEWKADLECVNAIVYIHVSRTVKHTDFSFELSRSTFSFPLSDILSAVEGETKEAGQ